MANTVPIRVEKEDVDKLMNECKILYLKEHPEMKGITITKKFMFKKAVSYFLKE